MNGEKMMSKYKTVKNVILSSDGNPMVERISRGVYDVLVHPTHSGMCIGCHYHVKNSILPRNCIGQCEDNDHIFWIHFKYSDIPKNAIVKRAKIFDTLIDENGGKWIILEDAHGNHEVAPKFSEPI